HARRRVAPGAEIDLMRAKALAGDRGKIFHLGSETAVKINEHQRHGENADAVGRRQILVVNTSMRAGSAMIAGVSKLSTARTKFKVPAARIAGRIKGNVTRRITPNSLEPRVFADSSSDGSMLFSAAATIRNASGVRTSDSTKISPGME